jgi:hypothetical protein
MLTFKNWLINETPDSITTEKGAKLDWNSGKTVFMFPGDYALYTDSGQYTHDEILKAINWIMPKIKDQTKLQPFQTDWTFNSTEEQKENRLSEIEKDIKAGVYIASNMKVKLLSHGRMSADAWSQINRAAAVPKNRVPGKTRLTGRTNLHEIDGMPHVLLGRIWPQEKIISFWNLGENVLKQSNFILSFIKLFGNPMEYKYDIRVGNFGEHEIIGYEDFMNKKNPMAAAS